MKPSFSPAIEIFVDKHKNIIVGQDIELNAVKKSGGRHAAGRINADPPVAVVPCKSGGGSGPHRTVGSFHNAQDRVAWKSRFGRKMRPSPIVKHRCLE